MNKAKLESVLVSALKAAARGATRSPPAEDLVLGDDDLARASGGFAPQLPEMTHRPLLRRRPPVTTNPIDPKPPDPPPDPPAPPPEPTPPDYTEAVPPYQEATPPPPPWGEAHPPTPPPWLEIPPMPVDITFPP